MVCAAHLRAAVGVFVTLVVSVEEDYGMQVIGHDDEFVQTDAWAKGREAGPRVSHGTPKLAVFHAVVQDPAEDALVPVAAQCDKVGAR